MHIFATGGTCDYAKRHSLSKTPSKAMPCSFFSTHKFFIEKRNLWKWKFYSVLELAQCQCNLWSLLRPGSSWVLKQGREHTNMSPALAGLVQGESYGWWRTKTTDLGCNAKEMVAKRWITVPPKVNQLLYSRRLSRHCPVPALGLYTVTHPKEESVCHNTPSVCRLPGFG